MSNLAVFLNRVASLFSSVIDWAAGLSVGFAVLLPCRPLGVGLRLYISQHPLQHNIANTKAIQSPST
jgi:hypothetical protein